jgi:Ca2+-binding RTX toxin-like protein
MPTTFDVFYLGIGPEFDTIEGNHTSENHTALNGLSFGGGADPLYQNVQTLAPDPVQGPGTDGDATAYAADNAAANERFQIDGGAPQTFDALMVYADTVVTYSDGTTAMIEAIVMQDTDGRLYLIPTASGPNADTDTLEAKPIEAITLGTAQPAGGTGVYGMYADRYQMNLKDEIVEGTGGDDLIDAGYTDDPEGDRVDNADNFEGNDDDVIEAGAGDDTVYAGAGDDTVYAGDDDDRVGGGAGDDALFGEAGEDTLDGGGGTDTIDGGGGHDVIHGDGVTPADAVLVAFEDFGDGASGWTDTSTDSGGAFGDFLGRFAGTGGDSSGGPLTEKTFDLADGYSAVVVEFDLYILDSWDADNPTFSVGPEGDAFQLYVNGEQIANEMFSWNDASFDGDRSGTITAGGVDYSYSFVQAESGDLGFSSDWEDQIWHVRLEAEDYTDDQITLGFGSTTNLSVDDESLGIDNLHVVSTNDTSVDVTEAGGHDLLFGGDGDDTIYGGAGDNTIDGGEGDDLIDDAPGAILSGNDDLDGGMGNDTIYAGGGADTVLGGAGDDLILGESGDNLIDGGTGDDTIWSGSGDDSITGGDDADTVVLQDGYGSDTIEGGEGGTDRDAIDASALTGDSTLTFTGDEAGTLASGPDGAAFIEIEEVRLGSGDDTIDASATSGGVEVDAGEGDDLITGGSGGDSLAGGSGADTIAGGDGDDLLSGGAGDDLFAFADGNGGNVVSDFDMADADEDGFTNDQLDVSDLTDEDGNPVKSSDVEVSDDGSGNAVLSFPGGTSVTLLGVDPDALDAGRLYSMGVPCFTAGTRIATPGGPRAVESLKPGDLVSTFDGGALPVVWTGRSDLDAAAMTARPDLRPVRIRAGALGNGRDLLLSPQHRVALGTADRPEGFVRARWLAEDGDGRFRFARGKRAAEYVHVMLPRHAVVLAEGALVESFYPGPQALAALDVFAKARLFLRFPSLAGIRSPGDARLQYGPLALPELDRHEMLALIPLPGVAPVRGLGPCRQGRSAADA